MGTAYPAMAIAAGSYYLGVHYQDNKLKQAGLFIIGASVASGLVTAAAKEAFGRVRPNSDQGPNHFFKSGNKSFWSGHTAQVFTLATVISEMYKEDYPIVPYVAYGLASITMYARVHSDSHWASDVIIGAVAGHLITKLFLSAMKDDNDGRGGLQIYPSFDNVTGTTIIVFEYRSKEKSRALSCSKIENEQQRVSACIAEVFELSSRNN